MKATGYFLIVGLILVSVAVLSQNPRLVSNAPQEIVALARRISTCVDGSQRYRGIEFSCKTPVLFADIRKLDLRADNRARSLDMDGSKVRP